MDNDPPVVGCAPPFERTPASTTTSALPIILIDPDSDNSLFPDEINTEPALDDNDDPVDISITPLPTSPH
jgi:hypothetical protein